jgi:hypothetical protein
LGGGAIADGETRAKNASGNGPLGAVYMYNFVYESAYDLVHVSHDTVYIYISYGLCCTARIYIYST